VLAGQNPPPGAVIYYYLKNAPKGETTIEILDSAGTVIRKYSSNRTEPVEEPRNPDDKKPEKQIKAEAGLNRFIWDERYEGTSRVPGYYLFEYKEGAYGPFALPGKYQVRLTVDGKSQTAPMEMKLDPRVKVEQADLQKQFDLGIQIRDELNRVYNAANQIEDVRTQVNGLMKRLVGNDSTKPVLQAAGDLDQKLLATRDNLIQLKIKANEDSLAYPQRADSKLAYLGLLVSDETDSAPTEAEYQEFDKLKKQTDDYLAHWAELQKTDLASFQKIMAGQNIQAIVVPTAEATSAGGEEPR